MAEFAVKLPDDMKLDKPIKHLLIDLDGTLVGARNVALSVAFTYKVLQKLRQKTKIWPALKAMARATNVSYAARSEQTNQSRIVDIFAEELGMDRAETEKLLLETIREVFPQLQPYFYPMPFAGKFLDWANGRFPITLATNPMWPEDIIKLRVQWANIDPSIFGNITHANKMHSCKPEVSYYEELLEQENLKPEECLLIGNHMENDLAATKLGIPVYIVGPSTEIADIPVRNGAAWLGSFPQLQTALEEHGY